jgi:hypothetical protein
MVLSSELPVDSVGKGDEGVFYAYAAVGLALFGGSIYAARRHSDTVGFVLTPLLTLALTWENLSIAVSLGLEGGRSREGILSVRGAVSSFVIPIFLVTLFELNYTVHKKRSSNFCCNLLRFDQGHRRSSSFLSHLVRHSMWLVGLAVLLLQIVTNSTYTAAPALAPRTARFGYKGVAVREESGGGDFDWQDVTDFVPWVLLLTSSAQTGLSLWRYGTTTSTDVRASAVNPWGSVFLATVGLVVAWVLSPRTWPLPYATNAMELALALSLVVTVHLVESNLRTLETWDRILQLANEALIAANARKEQAEAMLKAQQEAAERRKLQGGGGGGGGGMMMPGVLDGGGGVGNAGIAGRDWAAAATGARPPLPWSLGEAKGPGDVVVVMGR